jgi:NlpE N-terminal domain
MKRLDTALVTMAAVYLVACSSNDGSNKPKAVDMAKQDSVVIKPSGPPAKVNGTFKGVLPCDNCRETEAILTINGDKYSYTRLFKGMKVRGSNISNKAGSCIFDSGIVKLLTNNIAEDMFRIISEDTIKPLDAAAKPLKSKTEYFFIRSAKQEKL